MTRYAIMQEPGAMARATRRYGSSARPKRAATVLIYDEGPKFALGDFIHRRYLESGNQQYAGHRFEWRSDRSQSGEWRADDGEPAPRREWSVVVTLRNGARNVHETRFLVWRER